MKQKLRKWMTGIVCIAAIVSGCGMAETSGHDETPDAGQKSVVMVYMVGSNLESDSGLATQDILEMQKSRYDTNCMDVVICAGGTNEWWIDGMDDSICDVYELSEEGLARVYRLKNKNMGDENTLKEFINFTYANYEADYYDLLMWNHGGGAILGFGADENYAYDALTLSEISSGLKKTQFIGEGHKFEWVGFDACLMGMIEVADVMSDYAEYMIASEEVEAGAGWDYSCFRVLSDGAHFKGDAAAEAVINAFSESNENELEYCYDYTLSCMDLSKVDAVADDFKNLAVLAEEEITNGGYSRIARQRDQTKTFGRVASTSFYDTIDMYDFAENLKKLYPNETQALQDSLEELVVYEKSNVTDAHGVAVYFPYDNKEYAQEWIEVYENLGFSDEYAQFLKDFNATMSGESLMDWNISETAPMESSETAGEYYIQLNEEQMENYASAKFTVWEKDSETAYVCWLLSTDVALSEDGVLSSPFRGERFYLTDDSGRKVPCTALEMERTEEYSLYSLTVLVSRGQIGDDEFTSESVQVHVRVDEEHPYGEIAGIYKNQSDSETLFPEKTYYELEDGDVICEFLFARDIVFYEDGSVAPFEEWEASSGYGGGFALEGELRVIVEEPEEQGEYLCLFDLKDTQGNYCYTNPIYVEY